MIIKDIRGTLHNDPTQAVQFTLKMPPIGKGGNAWVYRAYSNDGTNKKSDNYIVKILRPSINGIEFDENDNHTFTRSHDQYGNPLDRIFDQRIQMMLSEASMMHSFQAESICMNISAVFDYNGTLAVAMPISGGHTLSEIKYTLPAQSKDVLDVISNALQITERIKVLHMHGKLHMDISPDNLFTQKDGSIRLLDFGSVCDAGAPVLCYSRKLGFSAPEAENTRTFGITKKRFGFEADIYSIGAVMYYMLFGCLFDRTAPGAYFFDEIESLPINAGSKEQLRYIFKQTLAFTPSMRCNNVDDLINNLKELHNLLQGFGVSPMRLYQKSIETRANASHSNSLIENTSTDDLLFSFEKNTENLAIPELISSFVNTLIYGESGSGKTTLIMFLWDQMLSDRKNNLSFPIPLYINLGNYPENNLCHSGDPNESFILRQLCVSCYGAADLSCCPPDVLSGILQEFCKDSSVPEYCLLLDGLDEVLPDNRNLIIDELERFSHLGNVRLIVTSRYCEESLESFKKYRFAALSDSCITQYLKSHDFDNKDIKNIAKNHTLMSLLRYPLYLSLICRIKKCDCSITDIYRSGQLIDRYFLSDNVGDESEIRRWKRMSSGRESSIIKTIDFCLKHLLPYIAFQMEYGKTRWSLSKTDFNNILFNILDEQHGWFASDSFLTQFSELADIIPYINSSTSFPQKLRISNRLMRIICSALCIMIEQNGRISFINQTVKKYMAALHIYNTIDLAATCGDTDILIKIGAHRWNTDTVRIAGDILYNRAAEPDHLIAALDLLRSDQTNIPPHLTAGLISILIARDGNLDGRDLSGLDLTSCDFSEVSCHGTHFDRSHLSDKALLGVGKNTYTYSVTNDNEKIFLLSGNRTVTVVDTTNNTLSEIFIETQCDMCVAAQMCKNELFTLGRCEGELKLCIEIFEPNGHLIKRIPIKASNINSSTQYQDIIAQFSSDGKWLAFTNSPVYHAYPDELIVVNCKTGKLQSTIAPKNVHSLRFCGDALHIITAERDDISYYPNEDKRIESNDMYIFDRLDNMILTKGENGLILSFENEARLLNFNNCRLIDSPSTRFQLCGTANTPICLITPKSKNVSYVAYFDDTPPRTIRADNIKMCTEETAIISLSETTLDGSKRYIGLFDIIRENWIVQDVHHRGMIQGSITGNKLLMTREKNAVLCDIISGKLSTFEAPEDADGIWLADNGNILYEHRSTENIRLESAVADVSAKINKTDFFKGKKGSLSVLTMSAHLDKALILAIDAPKVSVHLFDLDTEFSQPVPLVCSSIGKPQGHIMSDGRIALLSDVHKNGQKRKLLQITGIDFTPLSADVTEFRLSSSKLMLLSDGKILYLVSFEIGSCNEPWKYANTSVTEIHIFDNRIIFGDTKNYPCCCMSNPRIDCRYIQSPWLVMKRRFTGNEYSLLELRTGEEKTVYIDHLRFDGCSFSGCTGLSKKALDVLKNVGAKLE